MTLFAARGLQVLLAMGVTASAALLPMPSFAQLVPPQGTVTTQGHGEVKVRPDSLSVNVTVESKNNALPDARAENNRKMQAIIAALRNLKIANLKLETQGLNVYPIQSEYQKDRLPKVIGYQVNNNLNVTLTAAETESLGERGSQIVDAALNAGANNVGGLNFFLTDMTVPRSKALQLAVKDAKMNADTMAQAADITLTGVYSIEGSPQFGGYPRPVPMYSMKAGNAAAEMVQTPVETGETTVSSDVTVRFKF